MIKITEGATHVEFKDGDYLFEFPNINLCAVHRENMDCLKFAKHFQPMCADIFLDDAPHGFDLKISAGELASMLAETLKGMAAPVYIEMTNETWIWPRGTKLKHC
jgi:hypothetical protein